MLDAAGELVLRVHYKSMKCDVSFLQGWISTIFKWGGHFSYMCKKFLSLYNGAKIIKMIEIFQSYAYRCTATFFMVHSVYIRHLMLLLANRF